MSSAVGALALLLLVVTSFGTAAVGHYIPEAGDSFSYHEVIALSDGTGNYSGYSENTVVDGSESVTGVQPNGTVSATYQYSGQWSSNAGGHQSYSSSGAFTFSSQTLHYVQGTDNQTGYTNPGVWFYTNSSLTVGSTFESLNTPMTVQSTDTSYPLPGSSVRYVETILAQGDGTYTRNDVYGVFSASYSWQEYYDPSTGYIVGYLYTEHDSDPTGDGFTYTDTLYVTSTTYALTAGPAPPPGSAASPFSPTLIATGIGVVVVVLLVVIAVVALSRRRPSLPAHSPQGAVSYLPPAGAPPPVRLNPSDQPAVQQIIIRDTVKVNCRFCGTLIDSTFERCPNCGAPRT